ncbi:hypothetical protein R8Z50_21040 [Longispora sp. K20-0274]|uniref:hypothetical protein n=1 Tax=Longispora sp. K20-0274 TaxID=3088255 RepID=UPI00399BD9FC
MSDTTPGQPPVPPHPDTDPPGTPETEPPPAWAAEPDFAEEHAHVTTDGMSPGSPPSPPVL